VLAEMVCAEPLDDRIGVRVKRRIGVIPGVIRAGRGDDVRMRVSRSWSRRWRSLMRYQATHRGPDANPAFWGQLAQAERTLRFRCVCHAKVGS